MGGYDVHSDQVQTLVYICLAGISIDNVLKQAGVQIASKMSKSLLERLPGKVLTKINQKVGFRLITKFGAHGVINLHRLIPVVGGIIGGAFDASETKIISDRSYKLFIEGDMSILKNSDDNTECGVPVQ